MIRIDMIMPASCSECPFSDDDHCILYSQGCPDRYGVMSLGKRPEWCELEEIVQCKDCIHSVLLDKHAEMCGACCHCAILRGDETKNVRHKYKKYYKDYSLVYSDGYCSDGKRRDE